MDLVTSRRLLTTSNAALHRCSWGSKDSGVTWPDGADHPGYSWLARWSLTVGAWDIGFGFGFDIGCPIGKSTDLGTQLVTVDLVLFRHDVRNLQVELLCFYEGTAEVEGG